MRESTAAIKMRLAGIEPAHMAPEAIALSIGPQAHLLLVFALVPAYRFTQ